MSTFAVVFSLAFGHPLVKPERPACLTIRCRERVEMRAYRRRPMPWCTWGPESGAWRPEWSLARYRQPNVSGGTGGGKYQILTGTWLAHGGWGLPQFARPVVQERIARSVKRSQGLGAWVNC
jgi:hypothetical protein